MTRRLRLGACLGLVLLAGCEAPAKSDDMSTGSYIFLIIMTGAIALGAVYLSSRYGD